MLAFELAEYRAKREEGVKRLAESAKAQLLAIQQAQMQAGNLEATNAVTKAMAQLPITSPEKADPPAGVPTAAVSALKDHANKVFAGISGLNAQFVPRLEKVKTELLKSGDVAGANAADAKVRELKEEALKLTPPKTPAGRKPEAEESFTVEALIDGGTELHITKEGIYWMVPGGEAKPEIWSNWPDFSKRMKEFAQKTADATREIKAKGKDADLSTLVVDALNCKGCHDSYRREKK